VVRKDKGRQSSLDIQVCHSKIIICQGAAATESHKPDHLINHNDFKTNLVFFQQRLWKLLILLYKALVRC